MKNQRKDTNSTQHDLEELAERVPTDFEDQIDSARQGPSEVDKFSDFDFHKVANNPVVGKTAKNRISIPTMDQDEITQVTDAW